MAQKVVVIDYERGNLWSVCSALEFLGASVKVTKVPSEIFGADAIVLPGVGSFRLAMDALLDLGLDEVIKEAVIHMNKKILGICLGFQLLGTSSSEGGVTAGLGLINNDVDRFSTEELKGRKIPHVGFNTVCLPPDSKLFFGLGHEADFYFVHSYRMLLSTLEGEKATCNYGIDFLAAFQCENIFGTQFHPEKSQTNGLIVLSNFLAS